jgi:hypothetical protein
VVLSRDPGHGQTMPRAQQLNFAVDGVRHGMSGSPHSGRARDIQNRDQSQCGFHETKPSNPARILSPWSCFDRAHQNFTDFL